MMSDGKLHFWGGAVTVGSVFVVGHVLAPVPSLNGSSPSGLMVRLVWVQFETLHMCFNCRTWKTSERADYDTEECVLGRIVVPFLSWTPESNILYILHLDRN